MAQNFKLSKVFNSGDMPEHIFDQFIKMYHGVNDVHVTFPVSDKPDNDEISNWFIDNGAILGEKVLVFYSY